MSVAKTLLTVGAALGVGAVSVPAIGTVLSKPITGDTVPTRITDLAGYLTKSGGGRGLSGSSGDFPADDPSQDTSFGDVDNTAAGGTVLRGTAPTTQAPPSGVQGNIPLQANATDDKKRLLAVASFGGGVAVAGAAFFLLRRLLG